MNPIKALIASAVLLVAAQAGAAEKRLAPGIVMGDNGQDCNCPRPVVVEPTATPTPSAEELLAARIAALGFEAVWEKPGVLLVTLSNADVNFDIGKTDLKQVAKDRIAALVALMKDLPENTVKIDGHTDNAGSLEFNKSLSLGRAQAVQTEMLNLDMDPARFEAVEGWDFSKPLADNGTPEGRAKNRRVEIRIKIKVLMEPEK